MEFVHDVSPMSFDCVFAQTQPITNECDNELILVAYNYSQSYIVGNIKSGNHQLLDVFLNLEAGTFTTGETLDGVNAPLSGTYSVSLPAGNYSLIAIGIEWGGDQQYTLH